MLTVDAKSFGPWLRQLLRKEGVTEETVAGWLTLNVSNVSRKLSGITAFRREEIVILDNAVGGAGAVLLKAGYVPDSLFPPKGKYLDEAWLSRRLEEEKALLMHARLEVAEGFVRELLAYLRTLVDDLRVRKYRLRLELDLIDMAMDRKGGLTAWELKRARALSDALGAMRDPELSYDYESSLSDLAAGFEDHEEAESHEWRALTLVDRLEERALSARLQTETSLVNLMSYSDPESSEAERLLESVSSALWVPRYSADGWPGQDEADFLDVLQAQFNLRLAQGNLTEVGDVVEAIVNRFTPAPFAHQNVTSLLSVAEFYAYDGQSELMERYLQAAERLIESNQVYYFSTEVERIRTLTMSTADGG